MPRITGLLKRGPQLQASAAKNFSFTVSGQDSAKVSRSQLIMKKAVDKALAILGYNFRLLFYLVCNTKCILYTFEGFDIQNLCRPTQTQFQDNTQLLTTNTMLWLLVQAALAFVQHLVSSRRVSRLLSSPSSSPLAATLLPLKAASMQLWATWNLMIGDGTCTTLSKAPTGWEIRMQSTT